MTRRTLTDYILLYNKKEHRYFGVAVSSVTLNYRTRPGRT